MLADAGGDLCPEPMAIGTSLPALHGPNGPPQLIYFTVKQHLSERQLRWMGELLAFAVS